MSGGEKQSRAGRQGAPMPRHGPGAIRPIEKPKDVRGALKRLLGYMREYMGSMVLVVLLTVVSTLLGLVAPYLQGVAIDQLVMGVDKAGLIRTVAMIAGAYILGGVASMGAGYLMADVSQKSLKRLRKDLFEHIQVLSLSFLDSHPAGDLMSRLTNDIDAIGQAISSNVTQLISSLITLIGIVVMMFALNARLALASLIVFPIMVALTALIGGRTRKYFKDLQMNLGLLNSVMQETLTGQRVVIAFSQQETVNRKFASINKNVRELGIKAMTYAMLIPPLVGILSNANIAIVAGVGSYMVLRGIASIGVISAFITYSRRFASPLRQFANLYNSILSALAGAERIFEIIDTEPEIIDEKNAVSVDSFRGEVVFKDVDFGYLPGQRVLKNINLKAEPGQTIALVGPTGAGKTTIVNVLTRFYDIQKGEITIDGINIKKIKKDDLRRQLGIVLQDVFLFSGTVIDNIRYGNLEATDEDCIAAAKLANADGFIRRLPEGYNTNLTERATNLSQGQKQLLSIARAIVANPSILILDEATSSVDTRTEIQIQQALLNLMKGRTSFVIAHRLSTIRNADMVLVINHGEIIERGTHEELLEKKGFYYNLYMSQFKGTIDAEFEYIKPAEVYDLPRQTPFPLMGRGRPGAGGQPDMMRKRAMEVLEVFKKKKATAPESAKTLEELGLSPAFKTLIQLKLSPLGIIAEKDGAYYLKEENLSKL